MLVYKCDGESYSTGNKCVSEAENEFPTRWLVISGKIKNGLHDAHYLEANGTRHFCSRRCLESFLFKDVNPASGQSGINYMFDPNNAQAAPANQEAIAEQAAAGEAAVAATEQEAQEQAMESEG
jgi:hypothetical protein